MKSFQNVHALPRAEMGFKPEDILIVYAGRIALEKNIPFLIESFAGVAQAIPNAHLILIGGGVQPYEEEIQEMVQAQSVADRIHMTGRLPYDKLPAYLAMCDIFATASITEVHPLSVIEAMGAGLPVMGIHSVGVGDTVEDGVTGFLATRDIAAFTAKLTRLCLDAELRKQMSHSALEASSAYAIERTTKIMLSHYERLVRDSKPRKSSLRTRLRGVVERFLS